MRAAHRDQHHEQDLLMWHMTEAMEIDLAAAIRRSGLSVDSLGEMLRACSGCPEPGLCRVFLDSRPGRLAEAPSYCPNRARLAALRCAFPRTTQ